MRKVLVNENTLELARRQMLLAFKDCYLTLQHALLTFLKDEEDVEKRGEWKRLIRETGEKYKEVMENCG